MNINTPPVMAEKLHIRIEVEKVSDGTYVAFVYTGKNFKFQTRTMITAELARRLAIVKLSDWID